LADVVPGKTYRDVAEWFMSNGPSGAGSEAIEPFKRLLESYKSSVGTPVSLDVIVDMLSQISDTLINILYNDIGVRNFGILTQLINDNKTEVVRKRNTHMKDGRFTSTVGGVFWFAHAHCIELMMHSRFGLHLLIMSMERTTTQAWKAVFSNGDRLCENNILYQLLNDPTRKDETNKVSTQLYGLFEKNYIPCGIHQSPTIYDGCIYYARILNSDKDLTLYTDRRKLHGSLIGKYTYKGAVPVLGNDIGTDYITGMFCKSLNSLMEDSTAYKLLLVDNFINNKQYEVNPGDTPKVFTRAIACDIITSIMLPVVKLTKLFVDSRAKDFNDAYPELFKTFAATQCELYMLQSINLVNILVRHYIDEKTGNLPQHIYKRDIVAGIAHRLPKTTTTTTTHAIHVQNIQTLTDWYINYKNNITTATITLPLMILDLESALQRICPLGVTSFDDIDIIREFYVPGVDLHVNVEKYFDEALNDCEDWCRYYLTGMVDNINAKIHSTTFVGKASSVATSVSWRVSTVASSIMKFATRTFAEDSNELLAREIIGYTNIINPDILDILLLEL